MLRVGVGVCALIVCLLLSFWFVDDSQEVRWFRSNAQETLLTHSVLCLVPLLSFLL